MKNKIEKMENYLFTCPRDRTNLSSVSVSVLAKKAKKPDQTGPQNTNDNGKAWATRMGGGKCGIKDSGDDECSYVFGPAPPAASPLREMSHCDSAVGRF